MTHEIILALIVLLPIVPAYLLFRVLPSTGNVGGKLQGLEIKLGGAFAGYFALVLLIFYHYDKLFPAPPPPSAVIWHLEGTVHSSSGAPIEPLDIKDFSFSPPFFQPMPGGRFSLTIPTQPQEGGGIAWPTLVVSHDGFIPLKIPLGPEGDASLAASMGLKRDAAHKSITIDHITLDALPPYKPQASALAPKGRLNAAKKVMP